ncbi:cytochrome P450, partial [Mycena olivaceomarginata]
HIPWIIDTLHLFPQAGRAIQEFNSFRQDLARQWMKNGVAGPKDLWYHIVSSSLPSRSICSYLAADTVIAVIAGADTTAATMSSLMWCLLSNPEYYQCVQQAIDHVIVNEDDPFDVNKHQDLHLLSACINETMCLHPVVPSSSPRQVLLNQCGRNIAGRLIPKGTSVPMPYSLHRNPDYFSYPDQFLPNRWLPQSKLERHDTSVFIPFSLGPANCAGQKFAKHEMLMVLSLLFKPFDMEFADGFDSEAWRKNRQDYFVLMHGPLNMCLAPCPSTYA